MGYDVGRFHWWQQSAMMWIDPTGANSDGREGVDFTGGCGRMFAVSTC